jgi:hypothetical protein
MLPDSVLFYITLLFCIHPKKGWTPQIFKNPRLLDNLVSAGQVKGGEVTLLKPQPGEQLDISTMQNNK